MNLQQEKLNTKHYFYKTFADVRAAYGFNDDQKTFLKTRELLKAQGSNNEAFTSFKEYDIWERNMITGKRAGTWNLPKVDYQDISLSAIERGKALFDYHVKQLENNSDYNITDAYITIYRSNSHIFITFEEYQNFLNT